MKFEWDEAKRLANMQKHGIDFVGAKSIFEIEHGIISARPSGTEERSIAVGRFAGRLIAVVYTRRDDAWRIISARRARNGERRRYQELHG
jgi:uncharacterized DUF497 family protein